jgi:hypothetical protein
MTADRFRRRHPRTGGAPRDCASAVAQIMGYTGLLANFVVVSGPMPSAAAMTSFCTSRPAWHH